MAERKQCEFYVLRYVPDVVKEEFVNVGVVLLDTGEAGPGEGEPFADVRMTRDWRRVRCLDPDVEAEVLEAFGDELRRVLRSRAAEVINYRGPMSRREWLLRLVEESWSGSLQMGEMKAVLAESPEAEIGVLAKAYLERSAQATEQLPAARGIYAQMRGAFEKAGVWDLMLKGILAEQYTRPGDPFRVHCGYRVNGMLHMFQALPLLGHRSSAAQVNAAKALVYSFGELREGIAAKDAVKSDLTAIVEDELNERDRGVAFALGTLAEGGVEVARVRDLGEIAERARRELRV